MPELGKYAAEVLSAYVVSLVMIAGLIGASWRQFITARRKLKEVEEHHGKG